MNEAQIERAEVLLSYRENHGDSMVYGSEAAHREWWIDEAAAVLAELLPDWSTFK